MSSPIVPQGLCGNVLSSYADQDVFRLFDLPPELIHGIVFLAIFGQQQSFYELCEINEIWQGFVLTQVVRFADMITRNHGNFRDLRPTAKLWKTTTRRDESDRGEGSLTL